MYLSILVLAVLVGVVLTVSVLAQKTKNSGMAAERVPVKNNRFPFRK